MKSIINKLICLLIVGVGLLALTPALSNSSFSLASAEVAYAQESGESYQFLAPIGGLGEEDADGNIVLDVSSEDSLPDYIQNMIMLVIGFAIMLAIILIIAAGFQYMTSTSQSGVSKAKEQITNAVLGLVLALSAVVILQTINPNLIELNAIQTVTTTGDSLSASYRSANQITAPGDGVQCETDDESCYSEMYCYEIIHQSWFSSYFDQVTAYTCYDSNDITSGCEWAREEQINQIEEKLEASGNSDPRGNAEESVGDECSYVHRSDGEVYDIDSDPEESLGINVTGVGDSEEAALQDCREKGEQRAMDLYPEECGRLLTYEFVFDSSSCEVRCGEATSEPVSTPDSWDDFVWCSVHNPDSPGECRNNKATCQADTGSNCYRHPLSVDGTSTDCSDCVFVDPESYPIKTHTCSPEDTSTQSYCRIKVGLHNKLANLHSIINQSTSPLAGHYEVTETFPPTVEHQNRCHYTGSCIDLGLRKSQEEMGASSFNRYQNEWDDMTEEHAEKVADFILFAASNGLNAVYEIGDQNLRNELQNIVSDLSHGISEEQINRNIQHVSGVNPHFSVYDDDYSN